MAQHEVILEGQDDVIAENVLETIRLKEAGNPTLFLYGGVLMRLGIKSDIKDGKPIQQPALFPVTESELVTAMKQAADYYTLRNIQYSVNGSIRSYDKVAAHVPKRIATEIINWITIGEKQHHLPFPVLKGIIETPMLRDDGTILDQPGYDSQTGWYYYTHNGAVTPQIPETLTEKDIQQAISLIEEAIGDFPYEDPKADKANMIALLLTPILREVIHGAVPLALIDAPKWGTGKTLAAEVGAEIGTGQPAAMDDLPYSDAEIKKLITAMVAEGRTYIVFDNVVRPISSPSLARAITALVWSDRILGISATIKKPIMATWVATGNNIRVDGEMIRRCYRIRLNRHMSRPQDYDQFQHPDLIDWIQQTRMELVAALLTISRAYIILEDKPVLNMKRNGNFVQWGEMIGGILKNANIDGFLDNADAFFEDSDVNSNQWEAFLTAWYQMFGDKWITTADAAEAITDAHLIPPTNDKGEKNSLNNEKLKDHLPDELQLSLQKSPLTFAVSLGKRLDSQVDTMYGDDEYHLSKVRDKKKKKTLWQVKVGMGIGSPSPTQNQNRKFSDTDEENQADTPVEDEKFSKSNSVLAEQNHTHPSTNGTDISDLFSPAEIKQLYKMQREQQGR